MENFNLKKFLVENKLTTNSRMLNEEAGHSINYEKLAQILKLASNTHEEDNEEIVMFEKKYIKGTIRAIMELAKGVANEDEDVFDKLLNNPPATFESIDLTDEQAARWNDFTIALSVVSDIAYEYDFDDAAEALNDLAKAVDNFQL